MSKNIAAAGSKVYIGMSGGVDSSVTAALLRDRGYEVTGVYMKNWSQDLPGMKCPWLMDYQDAKRVAVQLGIGFKMYDFQAEYRQRVVDYMLEGYKAGITPNPDIMCNQEVKFKLFLETALADGADMIATGHYARIAHAGGVPADHPAVNPLAAGRTAHTHHKLRSPVVPGIAPPAATPQPVLITGVDGNKDQSYFLYRVTAEALGRSLMPIGEYEKPAVRDLARKYHLATADKKDSQGICFVGKVGIREFLEQFVTTEPGAIIDAAGRRIGEHDGALFYTIGQRHGLSVGGGLPYYVTGKDMAKNEVYVTTDLAHPGLWSREVPLTGVHWINGPPVDGGEYLVRTRYRAPLVKCKVSRIGETGGWQVSLDEDVRALSPGQSAVIYEAVSSARDNACRVVGGGIVI